jgi:hypothetical protein
MKPWQFTVLFLVGVGGAVTLLILGALGRDIPPASLTGVGTILAWVLATMRDHKRNNGPARDTAENGSTDE